MNKILISGGHLTPALALIDYIKENKIETEIVFFGRLFSQEINKQAAQEKKRSRKKEY